MSKTILAELDGFTPIIDDLVNEFGLVTAAVFGRMWRYCQMRDGVCTASLETIGQGLHVDKATIMRHAQKLVTAGYLADLTPDRRNAPHTYADTGKLGLGAKIAIVHDGGSVADGNTSPKSVAQCNATVAESKLKRVLRNQYPKKLEGASAPEPPKVTKSARKAPNPLSRHPAIQAIKSLTGRYPNQVLYPELIAALGEAPDLERLGGFFKEWVGRGFNPVNFKWVTEWYVNNSTERTANHAQLNPTSTFPQNGASQPGVASRAAATSRAGGSKPADPAQYPLAAADHAARRGARPISALLAAGAGEGETN